MKTIQELTTSIEELEKRIRAISTAQSTLSQLTAIREYIANVQNYLFELNQSFDSHTQNCTDYSDAISTIQSQIETINSTLANMSNISNEQITELTTTLNNVSTTLNQFLGTSTTSLETIETDISALQTELSTTQDDISDLQTEISTINTSIGEQNTSITNLQSAQTSLQATQTNLQATLSSQASQISSLSTNLSNNTNNITALTSRVSTCESNISTLTNGVDLSEFEKKLDEVLQTSFSYVDLCANFLINNTEDYSRFYSYKIGNSPIVIEKFKIKYSTQSTASATIKYLRNGTLTDTQTISLADHPNFFELSYTYYPTQEYNTFQFGLSCTEKIYVTGIEAFVFANNAQIFENDKDLKVECFNNNFYVTKYENESITYERIDKNSTLKISNLANDCKDLPDCYENARSGIFGPNLASNGSLVVCDYAMFTRERTNNKTQGTYVYTDQSRNFTSNSLVLNNFSPVYTYCSCTYGVSTFILDGNIHYQNASSTQSAYYTFTNISNFLPGKFYFTTACHFNNFINFEPGIVKPDKVPFLAYYQDGFLYALIGKDCLGVTKIARGGQFATAYVQSDNSINVYINRGYVTYKYNLEPIEDTYTYQVTFIEKIINCDCLYEAYNGIMVKHTQQGWILEEPTAIAPNTTETSNS